MNGEEAPAQKQTKSRGSEKPDDKGLVLGRVVHKKSSKTTCRELEVIKDLRTPNCSTFEA